MDATKKADRKTVKRFLKDVFATDADGNTHALARRMGIMYVIWNDRMYSAWTASSPSPTSRRAAGRRRSAPRRCGTATTCTSRSACPARRGRPAGTRAGCSAAPLVERVDGG